MAEPQPVGTQFVQAITEAGPFAIRVGDSLVRIVGLQPQLLAGVARASGLSWVQLIESPTADLTGALMLVTAVEQQCGVELSEPGTVAELLERFVKMPSRNGTGGDD